ncbi:hypothetical protein ACO0SA_001461 [Hanseniaspora valbyensis]
MVDDTSFQSFVDDDTLEDPIDISSNDINNVTINNNYNNDRDGTTSSNSISIDSSNNNENVLSGELTSPRSHTSQTTYGRQQQHINSNPNTHAQQSSNGSAELRTITADPSILDSNTNNNNDGDDSIDTNNRSSTDTTKENSNNNNNNNETNSTIKKFDRPNFIVGSGSDYSDTPHSTKVRKLTDAIGSSNIESVNTGSGLESAPKLKTQFKLKRAVSPMNAYQQGNEGSNFNNNAKLSHPFPVQRAASDINNETLRLPQVISVSKLNNSLHTSTPTISHVVSKEDMSSNNNNDHLILKKSLNNISTNNSTDDSVGENSNINLKIKKNQTVVKLPSESQIINNSIQTPRPKNVPSMNKTDYFAAKLADATNEKTNKEDDQEENFVYEDLMLDQDNLPSKKNISKIKHQNDEKDDDENNKNKIQQDNEKSIAKQTSKAGSLIDQQQQQQQQQQQSSVSNSTSSSLNINNNNNSQNSNTIPAGKNLTNQASVIIDPTRLLIPNKKSINSMSPNNFSDHMKISDKSMSNDINITNTNNNISLQSLESPVVFSNATNISNIDEQPSNNMKFLNVENTPSNLSSLSNRPSNLLNNRNNLTSTTAISQNILNVQKQEMENNPEAFHQHLPARPSLANLSTTSSNNNLSQYKKMMQNNARHSSVTVGILPNRQHNKNIALQQDRYDQATTSPTLNQGNGSNINTNNNNINTSDFYNDMLDYSSPNKKSSGRAFRDKSNRSSIIEEIQEDHSDFVIPTASSFAFDSGKYDNLKKSTVHDTLEETELNKKVNINNIPTLPFDSNKVKKSRQNSTPGSPSNQITNSNNKVTKPSFTKLMHRKSTESSIQGFINKGTDDYISHDEENERDDEVNGPFSSNFNNHLKNIMSETQSEWDNDSERNNVEKSTTSNMTSTALADHLKDKNQSIQQAHDNKTELLKSPIAKSFSAYDNISSHHHFGLDDDFDEDDFDERSSFFYHPRRNSQLNIGRISTLTSGSNNPRKMRSQKGMSYTKSSNLAGTSTNDNFLFDPNFNGSRLYDEETEQSLRNHFSSTNLNQGEDMNKDMDPDDNSDAESGHVSEHEGKFFKHSRNTSKNAKRDNNNRKSSRQYLWGEHDIPLDDENEYAPLTSENNRNVYYYDSIHDFTPHKNNDNGKKGNLMPHLGNHYYSSHDFYNNKNGFPFNDNNGKETLWSKIKFFIYWLFVITFLIMLGVGIGAFIVSNKELEEFSIASMANWIIAQDEILFDITAFAHNPSLLSISIQSVNIDIFAESQYAGDGSDTSETTPYGHKDAVTLLLGSVYELETPFVFKSDIFWRYFSVSTSSIKLKNPARSTGNGFYYPDAIENFIESNDETVLLSERNLFKQDKKVSTGKTTITLHPSKVSSSKDTKTSSAEKTVTSTTTKTATKTTSINPPSDSSTVISTSNKIVTSTATKTTTETSNVESSTLTSTVSNSTSTSTSTHTPPTPPPRKDKKYAQWKEISKYEFTMIIKGVAYYEVPFIKSQRSVPVQYQILVNEGKHKPDDH